jgi:hypothetical protein
MNSAPGQAHCGLTDDCDAIAHLARLLEENGAPNVNMMGTQFIGKSSCN